MPGKAAARLGDMVKQDAPHCHARIHGAPVPQAIPHPTMPQAIIEGEATVLIGKKPAATKGSKTGPCVLAGCTPGQGGSVFMGSATVKIKGKDAARVGDITDHPSCAMPPAALGSPKATGKILPPGCPTVLIGG